MNNYDGMPALPGGLGAIILDSEEMGEEPYIRVSVGQYGWLAPDGDRLQDGDVSALLVGGGRVLSTGSQWPPKPVCRHCHREM